MEKKLVYILMLLFSCSMAAQEIKEPLPENIISFKWSNDVIFETDYYYTNGLRFEFYFPFLESNPINYILLPSSDNSLKYYGLTLTQDLFTPTEVTDTLRLRADRPYAAYILIGSEKISFEKRKNLKIYSALELGIIGESAYGKETQGGIHDFLPTTSTIFNWLNQIKDDFAIMYTAEVEKGFWEGSWFNVNGITSARLGSPYTNLDAGLTARAGKYDHSFFQDFAMSSNDEWQGYLFADMRGRFVVYNATLQGGLFNNNSIYTIDDINRWVGDFSIGITAVYKYVKLDFGIHHVTPEFPEGKEHRYGYLSIRAGF
jgi:hypothetical protein